MAVPNGEITKITIAPYRGTTALEADVKMLVEGQEIRRRWKSPHGSRTSTERWAREKAKAFLNRRASREKEPTPTFGAFAPAWVDNHITTSRLRPSTADNMRMNLREHLLPRFAAKRLDELGEADIDALKRLPLAPGTVNKILQLLSQLLKAAAVRGGIAKAPVVKRIKVASERHEFYPPEEYDRLVQAAGRDPRALVLVLLSGDAGLRAGEIVALDWKRVDFAANKVHVEVSDWRGHLGPPKSGKPRSVPMTPRLREALLELPRDTERVLMKTGGRYKGVSTRSSVNHLLRETQAAAGLPERGPHILRHTFCSHLAMAGVPVTMIRDLAGHSSIAITNRYMHLAPAATTSAIDMLVSFHTRATSSLEKSRRRDGAPPKKQASPAV
jgi:integrase